MNRKPEKSLSAGPAFCRSMAKPAAAYTAAVAVIFCVVYMMDRIYKPPEIMVPSEYGMGAHSYKPTLPIELMVTVFLAVWLVGFALLAWYVYSRRPGVKKPAKPQAISDVSRQELQKVIRKRYLMRFSLSFLLYTAVLGFFAVAVLIFKDARIWYASDPLYPLLNFLRNISPIALAALWLGGAVLLLFYQWRQCASDVVGLIDSIEQMQLDPDTTDITVPKNLAEIRPILQGIQYTSQKSRQQAKEAEQRKNELIVYLAHDLKTPLTSVMGYLNLLNEASDLPADLRARYTGIALEKAVRLENMLGQFFEISRYNLHEMVLEPEHFDLHYLLLQLAEEFYPALKAQSKSLEVEAPEELWAVGDSDKLARVFNNILRNAAAYSEPGSTIYIRAARTGQSLAISFQNTGKTIPSHRLQAIFEKFYRMDEARSGDSGGAGLGLAIAKEIVTLHGGAIEAQSGEGLTTITVTLPAAWSPSAAANADTSAAAEGDIQNASPVTEPV